jgi:hypothetical protein
MNSICEVFKFPVPQSQIYKNTCIIILDNAVLKDTQQLNTHWLNYQKCLYLLLHFLERFGSSEEALRFPVIKSRSTESS